MKPKRCAICKQQYEPRATFQRTCSPKCAMEWVEKRKAHKAKRDQILERKQTRAQLMDQKKLSYWAGRAQSATNAVARYRDRFDGCISCDKRNGNVWHGGHYYTTKAHPELRFDLRNIHKQCFSCNYSKSGNLAEYLPRLIAKIGQEEFDDLSKPRESPQWTREDYQQIEKEMKQLLKEMKEKE